MAKPVLIIKNITREGPGIIEKVLEDRRIPSVTVDLDQGEIIPPFHACGAVIILGGPDSANDESEKIAQQLKLVKECLSMNIPFLGICLGFQILVKAAGGEVVKATVKEVGFFDADGNPYEVTLTETGTKDFLFRGFHRDTFNVFQLHGETVRLTERMHLLATSSLCPYQIVRVGTNAYGVQCHFELTSEVLDKLLKEDPDFEGIDVEAIRGRYADTRGDYRHVGKRIVENFLKIAGIIPRAFHE